MLNEKLAYHFTSVDTAVKYILPNNTIMMNNFNKVNDPKESKDWPFNFYSITSDQGRNFSKTLFSKARTYLNEHIFMTCFKVEEEEQYLDDYTQNRAFFDMRMWNEYGDKHKGVMLAFDFDLLESAYSDTGELMYSGPVRYTYDLTNIDWFQPIKKWEGGYFEFFFF
ncbi:hypothetical protein PGRAN_04215 [Listeria grandensis FSL F6-0971]|uniref:Uncharacterized protein n=1 Tax=Listeria grandensis FSL F6-0971 TaxID=1265819 RepID=W7BJR7_9LIST|nr:DUF2971 domain-containing protein [Listeria grandensis]EUJ25050.1 hypothetical protein PGRAN_04215 [Listeria grandensis FSL F6-0971]